MLFFKLKSREKQVTDYAMLNKPNKTPGNWFSLIALFLFISCYNNSTNSEQTKRIDYPFPAYPTVFKMNPEALASVYETGNYPDEIEELPGHAFPFAGTVSHHLLVAPYIDQWFKALKLNRNDIKTFIIISPHHWIQGYQYLSLSSVPWDYGEGIVEVDLETLDFITTSLDIPEDPDAFLLEHGIGTLIPFISMYYPEAKIVPILQREKPLRLKYMKELSEVILDLLQDDFNRYFVIVSIDFSHHHGPEVTEQHDIKSGYALKDLNVDTFMMVNADNRGGIFLLLTLLEELQLNHVCVLNHTNSYLFSGKQPDDITSYFFTFYY